MDLSMNRYAADIPFPPYAFVPGRHPHPVTDSRGHQFGQSPGPPLPLNPEFPRASRAFLYAIDLFNAGFYWEAHETWEGLWIAAGRGGQIADFLKGLIKLAAAGVKAREGQPVGVQRHAKRAAELFRSVWTQSACAERFAGLVLNELIDMAESLAAHPIVNDTPSVTGLPVFGRDLCFEAD
jgi:uncharacterized protein